MILSPSLVSAIRKAPQVIGRNEQRLHTVNGVNIDQRRPAGQLPHLGDEIAGSQFDNGGETSQRIASRDPDRTGNENEHARSIVARDEKRLACSVVPDLAEAAQALNLIGTEFRKHLLIAGINGCHGKPCFSTV